MRKKRLLVVGYGLESLFLVYKSECLSSRALYGMIELSDIYNYDVEYVSLYRRGLMGVIRNNIILLRPVDRIIMPYLYIQPLVFWAFLRSIGLIKKRRLVVISHKTLERNKGVKKFLYKMIYKSVDVFFFHSQKNLEESQSVVEKKKTKFLFWGENLEFVDKMYNIKDGSFFLSTGRENRDFEILASAFANTHSLLEIYTNKTNYSTSYESLENLPLNGNVKVFFVDRSNDTTMMLAQKVAECFCVVIPLKKEHIHYCVGLTSIVEAMSFGKPIISTRNPYSPIDIEKEGLGFWVDNLEDWIRAISILQTNITLAKEMGYRGRQLAERKFNIKETAKILNSVLC